MSFSSILDWIYPPTCIACRTLIALTDGQPRHMRICLHCQALFQPIAGTICKTCGTPTRQEVERCVSCYGKAFHFTHNHATFVYDDIVRDLLLDLKFNQKKQIAESLGKVWAQYVTELPENTILVPLPLHRQKQKERSFNQAEILALHISQALNIPMQNALVRIVDTPPQSGLHPRQRVENIAGAFARAPGISATGKNYIIIDDIYTTGASLNECAKVLMEAGAATVSCMTLSVVQRKKEAE